MGEGKTRVHVVTPEWLWTCAERWERVDERLFPLQRGGQVYNFFYSIYNTNSMFDNYKLPMRCHIYISDRIFSLSSINHEICIIQSTARRPPAHCSSPPPAPPVPALRKRTPSGRFMDTLNPLLSFSSDDIADMDREVNSVFYINQNKLLLDCLVQLLFED